MINKRGIAKIIVVILLILMVLVFVLIIWNLLIRYVGEETEVFEIKGQLMLEKLSIEKVEGDITQPAIFKVSIKKGAGKQILINVSEIEFEYSNVGVVSVIDLSGSMQGNKLNEAKESTKSFIDSILNVSGNKVGLVGYRNIVSDSDCHSLSGDSMSLKTKVGGWTAYGSTCICCGINKAVDYLFPQSTHPVNQLKAYYNFDNNVLDHVSENDGTISGTTTYAPGLKNSALEFNGNANVEIPDIITSKQGSISIWIKPTEMVRQTIFDASTPNKYFFIDIDNSRHLRFFFEDSSDVDFNDARYDVSSLSVDNWHHVVAIWRHGNSPATQLYLDGTLVKSDNNVAGSIADFLTPYIGKSRSNYVTTWDFRGLTDELRIYNKILSFEEIQGLYNKNSVCGNSIIEVGEVCDKNNQFCESGGFYGTQECNSQCNGFETCDTIGACGDSMLNSGEECDDGNTENDDGCSAECKLEYAHRVMVVMSDGEANRQCAEQGTGNSKQDAIKSAKKAHEDYDIKVYAVGFGTTGIDKITLQSIADAGNGSYHFADVSELNEIYKKISEEIKKTYGSVKTFGYLKIVFFNETDLYEEKIPFSNLPTPLETKTYSIDLEGKITNIIKIEIYPVAVTKSGKEIIGPKLDAWYVEEISSLKYKLLKFFKKFFI